MSDIPVTRLRELIRYEADSGKLFWLPRVPSDFEATETHSCERQCKWWNTRFAGCEALAAAGVYGCKAGKLFGRMMYAHRVVFALEYGRWPMGVDHIDGDRANNKLTNLREVHHSENMRNKRRYSSNKSGCPGVTFVKRSGKWAAFIGGSGGRKHLGCFSKKEAAVEARRLAERQLGYHENHGRAA